MVESTVESVSKAVVDLTEETPIHVLHVDDEAGFLKSAKQILEMQGNLKVETALSVEEALKKMEKKTFDIVVSDYQMPEKDGLEFLRELREKGDNIPFIMFTGKGREEVAIEALNLGADYYINKIGKPETVYGELAHGVRQAVERKRAAKEVWKREQKLRAILASSPDAITVSDLEGKIVECNEAAWKLTGFSSKEELLGKSSFELIAEKDRKRALKNLKKTFEQGTVKNIEYTLLKKDGEEYTGELSASILKDTSGTPIGFVGVVRDITERKETEERIKASEQKYRRIVELAPDIIVTSDLKGVITSFNTSGERISGYSKAEVIGKHFSKIGHIRARDLPKYLKILTSIAVGRIPKPFEATWLHKDGTPHVVEVHVGLLKQKGKPVGIQGIIRDVTERKKAEEALQRKTEDLALINSINNAINRGDSLQKVIQLLAKGTQKILSCSGATAYLLSKDRNFLIMQNLSLSPAVANRVEKLIGMKIPQIKIPLKAGSVYLKVLQTGEPELINGPAVIQRLMIEFTETVHSPGKQLLQKLIPQIHRVLGIKSVMVVPLVLRGVAIGLMDVSSNESFTESDLERFEIISKQLTVAINRKQVENGIRQAEEKYRSIVELAPDSIMTFDLKGVITSCNTASTRLSGYSKDELVGKHFSRIAPIRARDIPKFLRMLPLTFSGKVPKPFEVTFKHRDGTTHQGEVHVSLMKTEGRTTGLQAIMRDITNRKKMDERLKKASEEWKRTFDAISDFAFIVDKDFRLMKVNKAFSNILNKKPEELIGKHCFEVLHGTNKPWLNCPHKKTLKTKKPTTEEVFDPNIGIPLLITNSPILDENGEITGCVHIAKDISERKKIEETLRLQRDVAASLMRTSSLEESVNRLFDKFLELKEFDCAGFYLVDKDTGELDMILHRGLPEGFVEKVSHFDADSPYARVVMEGEPVYQKTSDFPPIIREDLESDGILAVAAIPIHYKGEVIADLNLASHSHDEIPTFTRNVLESTCAQIGDAIARARMEERLRMHAEILQESERKYRGIVELAPDGIATMNMKGVVTSVNSAFLRLTGFSKDEIVGKHFTKIGTLRARDLPRYIKLFGSIVRGKIPPPMEFAYLRKDGTQCWGEAHNSLLKEGGKTVGFQAILRDTTGRKKTLEKLKMLSEKLSVVGKLTRHDVRNKLFAVTNNVYLARQTLIGDSKTSEYLEDINSSCGQMERILDFATDYEKLGVEELTYIDVEKSVEDTVSLISDLKGAKVMNDCHELEVLADSLLRQLFYNLIDNSLRHGERVSQIRVFYEVGKDKMRLVYEDDGVGIPKAEKEKIFEEGYGKSTGYGLYLIRKMCEVYGWTIKETGKKGRGAQFIITIPKINESGKIAYKLR